RRDVRHCSDDDHYRRLRVLVSTRSEERSGQNGHRFSVWLLLLQRPLTAREGTYWAGHHLRCDWRLFSAPPRLAAPKILAEFSLGSPSGGRNCCHLVSADDRASRLALHRPIYYSAPLCPVRL